MINQAFLRSPRFPYDRGPNILLLDNILEIQASDWSYSPYFIGRRSFHFTTRGIISSVLSTEANTLASEGQTPLAANTSSRILRKIPEKAVKLPWRQERLLPWAWFMKLHISAVG